MPDGERALRAVIVDDEPLARKAVREALGDRPDVTIVGEAADAPGGIAAIDGARPDVVFLDVEMPGGSGLDVLERARHRPAVVFTTAHDHYAIRALQAGAVDYVVKPFGAVRLSEAVDRVVERRRAGVRDAGLVDRLRELLDAGPALKRLYVRRGRDPVSLSLDHVMHVEASDDYVTLHAEGEAYLFGTTMSELERQLDPDRFLRVHRSHIVNLDYVVSAEREGERRFVARLRDGREVPVSRAGAAALRRLADATTGTRPRQRTVRRAD